MRTRAPPNSPLSTQNDQAGRITPASAKCLLCGIPHKRHSFAVQTILDAHRSGRDVGATLALLSTYLGHVDPKSTYWYLEAAPDLMAAVGERLERYLQTLR
jgi:hypothetical protein